MSSASFAKSSTIVPFFSGCVRLSRESVWTAFTPPSFLSTYIVCRSGWSKPVWNLFATIRKRYSGPLENLGRLASPRSRSSPTRCSHCPPSCTVPENATRALKGWPVLSRYSVHGELVAHGVEAGAGHDHGLGLAADLVLDLAAKCSTMIRIFSLIACGWRSTKALRRYSAFVLIVAGIVLDLLESANRPCRSCSSRGRRG